jgi:hypothetical protein
MTGTVTLLAVLLIVLLGFLLHRSKREPASDGRQLLADGAANNARLPADDRRKELLDRMFGPDDWEFILSRATKDVQRLFLRERRELAFCWLSEIRSRAKAAMRIHIARARASQNLEVLPELRLMIEYFLIQAKCGLVAAVLWLRGPVGLRRMVQQIVNLSDQLGGLTELALRMRPVPSDARVR